MSDPDSGAVRKKAMWRIWFHPATFYPAVVGGAVAAIGGALSAPIALAIGLAGVAWSAGSVVWNWTVRRNQIYAQAAADVMRQEQETHYDYLRQLHARMRHDGDPRTRECVRQLQGLFRRMRSFQLDTGERNAKVWNQVKEQVQLLYSSCLTSLERTLTMSQAAEQMTSSRAKDQLLANREQVVQEVYATVNQLEATLDQIQTAALESRETPELGRMRQELEAGLDVARNVEQRMEELEAEWRRAAEEVRE